MSAVEQSITTEQQEWLDGLRAMAEWFEQHPERIQLTGGWKSVNISIFASDKTELVQLVRELGRVEKIQSNGLFYCRRRFGPHSVDAVTSRSKVCTRVVTGTRLIPEEIVPAREEEIVEWECDDPLLKVAS